VPSVEDLLTKVDVVMLETNDGRRHLEQARTVLEAGKRMFIDKPLSASLADAMSIFEASRKHVVPVFSSSSLRYITGAREIRGGKIGKVLGADTYSPAPIEKTHPDLFWYGIHGVETLFTVMGTGCRSVVRYSPIRRTWSWADGMKVGPARFGVFVRARAATGARRSVRPASRSSCVRRL